MSGVEPGADMVGTNQVAPAPWADAVALELHAWKERSLAVGGVSTSPWPDDQATRLVEAMVRRAVGIDVDDVDARAREWAATTPTLLEFARRLGTLRAGFGVCVARDDPDASVRIVAVVSDVAVASTAQWLAPVGIPQDAHAESPALARLTSWRGAVVRILADRRVRDSGIALVAGAAAAAVVVALATSAPPARSPVRTHSAAPHPAPSLSRPPAGGRRANAVAVVARGPSTGVPVSGRATRGSAPQFVFAAPDGSGSTPSPGSGSRQPLGSPPATLPVAVTVPSVPSIPSVVSLAVPGKAVAL